MIDVTVADEIADLTPPHAEPPGAREDAEQERAERQPPGAGVVLGGGGDRRCAIQAQAIEFGVAQIGQHRPRGRAARGIGPAPVPTGTTPTPERRRA